MSLQTITQYYSKVDKIIQYGGSKKEMSIRNAFYHLLEQYGEEKNLVLVAELPIRGTKGKDVTPDGTLKNVLRLDYGYWESKDEYSDLDEEIDKKVKKGYPLNNILFEDSQTAILFQNSQEVMRIDMRVPDELNRILKTFVNFEKPEIRKFNDALSQFQEDIPIILKTLRERIDEASKKNKNFISISETFLELCKAEINPDITTADVREMMIQHILTSDIFNKIFDDPEFHKHNNIASELERLIETLFSYSDRRNLLGSIEHYYEAINAAAAGIVDHHERQRFLKALYENFYKAYNPKAADRLGVVYTPNRIVDFMIDSCNHLLEKHFKRQLWDKNVDILDPATGTGTYICNIIDKCPNQYLANKYKKELHANDVAILPYYVANLNIEFTFKQKMGYYEEFQNICFVDTLDNTDSLVSGKNKNIFALSSENSRRINEQNRRKISVIIGNPPYNAMQKNINDENSNRKYPYIDKRIKDTYLKLGTAQNQNQLYDMYVRFYRWAMDRIDKNGVIALITNRSFIEAKTFDGFRQIVQENFNYCYIIDTKSDVRTNPKISGTGHNVFGIQTGVAVMFLIKSEEKKEKCKIHYVSMIDEWKKEEKLQWFEDNPIQTIQFETINPDKNNNWINLSDTDFETLLPLIGSNKEDRIFIISGPGIQTGRDEWVYDFSKSNLEQKSKFLVKVYNESLKGTEYDKRIKWTSSLHQYHLRKIKADFDLDSISYSNFRPFIKQYHFKNKLFNHRITQNHKTMYGDLYDLKNSTININTNSSKGHTILATDDLTDIHFNGDTQCLSEFYYSSKEDKHDNITDWALNKFILHYKDKSINKKSIFNYIYSVLQNPNYISKYQLNLNREFPRVPLYKDFWKWQKWGEQLMKLHINFEKSKVFDLKRTDEKEVVSKQKEIFNKKEVPEVLFKHQPKVKAKLKADKQKGEIYIDEITTLSGVPSEAWDYKISKRSAIEWVLDQYKESKPSDPTIADKFDDFRFSDYKEEVIELIKHVTTVSIETMRIVNEMKKEKE